MGVIHLKKRIGKFYESINDEELVFVIYEDVDDYVHFYYLNQPHERDKMCSCHFLKEYKRF
ncbi:hypothetical protein, partial [Paenibacillus alba]